MIITNKQRLNLLVSEIESQIHQSLSTSKCNEIRENLVEEYCNIILGEKIPFSILGSDGELIIEKNQKIRAPEIRLLTSSIGSIAQDEDSLDLDCPDSLLYWKKIQEVEYKYLKKLYSHYRELASVNSIYLKGLTLKLDNINSYIQAEPKLINALMVVFAIVGIFASIEALSKILY